MRTNEDQDLKKYKFQKIKESNSNECLVMNGHRRTINRYRRNTSFFCSYRKNGSCFVDGLNGKYLPVVFDIFNCFVGCTNE